MTTKNKIEDFTAIEKQQLNLMNRKQHEKKTKEEEIIPLKQRQEKKKKNQVKDERNLRNAENVEETNTMRRSKTKTIGGETKKKMTHLEEPGDDMI